MKLNQLFCKHIWKSKSTEYIRTERESYGLLDGMLTTYANFLYYSERQFCIKCDKRRTIERRYMAPNS